MIAALIVIFVLAYAAIALEEPFKVDKSAAALIGAGLLWTVFALGSGDPPHVSEMLVESLGETAQIAFFLMGAMTIVEIIDSHDGFAVITSRIRARKLSGFVLVLGGVTFFLSAALDNLTTTIVMISLSRKLLGERDDRLYIAGIIVISANAGGAWSPIGDVTTTMLWIGGQVTSVSIVTALIIPSLINMAVPLGIVSYSLRGRTIVPPDGAAIRPGGGHAGATFERNLTFGLGVACLLAVPVFKTITHLPPFLGILFALGILWATGDLLHRGKPAIEREPMAIANALRRIDLSAIVFFIGILLAVSALQYAGILATLAGWLDRTVGRLDAIALIIGLVSAIVDNVPMIAASIGMYPLATYPPDSFLWEFLAYAAGTGGSIMIIGSAAGVAAMSLERIEFFWYMRRFSPLALAGYFAGAFTYIGQEALLGVY